MAAKKVVATIQVHIVLQKKTVIVAVRGKGATKLYPLIREFARESTSRLLFSATTHTVRSYEISFPSQKQAVAFGSAVAGTVVEL